MNRVVQFSWLIILSSYFLFLPNVYCNENKSRIFFLQITPLSTPDSIANTLSRSLATEVQIKVIGQSMSSDSYPRQRNPEMSEDQLVIIGLDKHDIEIMRTLILDPRVIRAESADEQGRIVSAKLFQNNIEFTVVLPDNPELSAIEIHHPHWNGELFLLRLQGRADITIQQNSK